MTFEMLEADDASIYEIHTNASGPRGKLPLTDEMLRNWSSGDLFGLTQSAGMGWKPEDLLGPQYLLLSTQGGVRAPTASRSRSAITRGIGKLDCSCRLRPARSSKLAACRSRPFAAIRATADRKGRPACLTACLIATTPP